MKNLIFILFVLCFSSFSYAGSANCTGSVTITSGMDRALTSDDCIIVVNIPLENMTYARGFLPLPANATTGDEFTIKDISPAAHYEGEYEDPETHEMVQYSFDMTGGVGLEAVYPGEEFGESYWSFSPNHYIKAVFDGERWVFSDGEVE